MENRAEEFRNLLDKNNYKEEKNLKLSYKRYLDIAVKMGKYIAELTGIKYKFNIEREALIQNIANSMFKNSYIFAEYYCMVDGLLNYVKPILLGDYTLRELLDYENNYRTEDSFYYFLNSSYYAAHAIDDYFEALKYIEENNGIESTKELLENKIRKALYQMYHYRSIVVDESLTTSELIKEITPKFYEIDLDLNYIYNVLNSNTADSFDDKGNKTIVNLSPVEAIFILKRRFEFIADENGNFSIEKYKNACIRDQREKSVEEQDFDTGDTRLDDMDDEILFTDDDDTYL